MTMQITWGGRPNSYRTKTNPREDSQGYVLTGVSTMAMAKVYAGLYSPWAMLTPDGFTLYRTNIDATEAGFLLWHIDVSYSTFPRKEPQAGDQSWNFDTLGATKHVTQSLSTTWYGANPALLPNGGENYQGAIGVNENGDVEGVDVVDRSYKWTETWKLPLSQFGWSYSLLLGQLTGTINQASFRGLAPDCVLFEGAQGGMSRQDPSLLDVTYHFNYSPERDDFSIAGVTGISKVGQDYLWVSYKTKMGANRKIKVPAQVNVERLFNEQDFSQFGIGSSGLVYGQVAQF
jgi:hypothetical protein